MHQPLPSLQRRSSPFIPYVLLPLHPVVSYACFGFAPINQQLFFFKPQLWLSFKQAQFALWSIGLIMVC
jgi:hypothetical protein